MGNPIPLWIWAILGAIMAIGGGMGLWFFWQTGSSILSGVQQASPGIGQMVASIGMLFTLMPPILMMLMMMSMFSRFAEVFG